MEHRSASGGLMARSVAIRWRAGAVTSTTMVLPRACGGGGGGPSRRPEAAVSRPEGTTGVACPGDTLMMSGGVQPLSGSSGPVHAGRAFRASVDAVGLTEENHHGRAYEDLQGTDVYAFQCRHCEGGARSNRNRSELPVNLQSLSIL